MRGFVLAGVGAALLMVGACSGGASDDASVDHARRALERLPASEYDVIVAEDGDVEILFGDLVRTAEAAAAAEPTAGRGGFEIEQWIARLAGRDPDQRSPLALELPTSPVDVWADPEITLLETGIDVGAVTSFVSLTSPPRGITVLVGDVDVTDELPEVAAGLRTAGSGDDFEENIAEATELRIVGRPLRLAEGDGAVAYSFSTQAAADFVGDGSSVIDRGDYAAVAAALDAAGVVNGAIVESDFSRSAAPASAVVTLERVELVPEPFDAVAMGVGDGPATIGAPAVTTVVYSFPDAAGAARSLDAVESLWTETVWANTEFRGGLAIEDLFGLDSVERDDRLVVVTLVNRTQSSLRVLTSLVPTAAPMFVHD